MKYYDCHMHLRTPDEPGLGEFLRMVEDSPNLVGGNIILNTQDHVEFLFSRRDRLPQGFQLIPYFGDFKVLPDELINRGWFKIHPRVHRITVDKIPELIERLVEVESKVQGLIIDCFPWGPDLEHNIYLPLVITVAKHFPKVPILATHGGGYLSWQIRAHTMALTNVIYDFSFSMAFYEGSDLLVPLKVYLRSIPTRLLFGSDWPFRDVAHQVEGYLSAAKENGTKESDLELVFYRNALQLWS